MFFALDLVELKTEFLGYLKRRVLCSQVISAASAIANNDVKIKEIISNFCRTTKWLGRLPLVHEFRTSISTFALVYQYETDCSRYGARSVHV